MPRAYVVAPVSLDPERSLPWPALGNAPLHGAVKIGPDDLFGAGSPLRLWDIRASDAALSAIQAAMVAAGTPNRFIGSLPSQVRAQAWQARVFRKAVARMMTVAGVSRLVTVNTAESDVQAGDTVLATNLIPHRWLGGTDIED